MTATNDAAINELANALGIAELKKMMEDMRKLLESQAPKSTTKPATQAERLAALETQVDDLVIKVELFGKTAGDAQKDAWAQEAQDLKGRIDASYNELKVEIDKIKTTQADHAKRLTALDDPDNGTFARLEGRVGLVAQATEKAHDRIDGVERKLDLLADREVPIWTIIVGGVFAIITFIWVWSSDFSQTVGEGEAAQRITSNLDVFWVVVLLSLGVGALAFGLAALITVFTKPKGYEDETPENKTDENKTKTEDPVPA